MTDTEKLRVALYARVSTRKQADKEIPIDSQLKEMRSYAQSQGWKVVAEFLEKGESARTDKRDEFQRMVNMVREGNKPFDLILVWDFSRFARDRKVSILYKEFLRLNDVRVVSMKEPVDDSPSGEMTEGIFELLAEHYWKALAQNTMRGMCENASRGYRNGGTTPMGYQIDKFHDGNNVRARLKPNPVYAPIIRRIFMMYAEGNGIKEIVNILNREGVQTNRGRVFNIGLVNRILRSEVYVGTQAWNQQPGQSKSRVNKLKEAVKVPNNHPAIIDQETFDAVQATLDSRNPRLTHPRESGSKQLLKGLLYCGLCGSSVSAYPAKSSAYFYYICNIKRKQGTNVCNLRNMDKDKFERYLMERIREEILTDEHIEYLVKAANEEIGNQTEVNSEKLAVTEKQLVEAKKKLDHLIDAVENGQAVAADLADRIHERTMQCDLMETQKMELGQKLKGGTVEFISHAAVLAYVDNLRSLLDNGTIAERRAFLRSFINRIEIFPDEVVIKYRVPSGNKQGEQPVMAVLPMVSSGSGGRI